ncbi:N-6 DNA methylase [Gramella sp. GC03-9]|uniref:site-specific DNA-methyltransferase (adenine-specific) n=1 Tax=Christiangramia oceanisediminis TaxID=2920386 RepID=A0A9X2KYK1_9FLAO|nr:TaqI-like C-terminal specificity domain-containing protein [Gramella oceanisediminis]MCP9200586.1 N-6 DNA methylase [Gramella oceanisediminis]
MTEQEIDSNNFNILKPRKALNKAFLKVKPNRSQIERFKDNLKDLLDRTNDTESEEFHKNLVIDFLKKTYYDPNHFINTKGRNDLVIHNGNKAKSTVGVIIEAKKPTNRAEMLSKEKINVKAFQELVLYYLRERISQKNLEVKYVIATNINEWFIFDANFFDKAFAQNKRLVSQFIDFEAGRLAGKTTDFFYKEIAEPFIAQMQQEVEFTHFDIRNFEKPLRNNNPKDDNKLIALFKLLSPEHLLKLPFTNDSNSLDKRFYGELLHIIGLTETKQGGKKVIERQKEGHRNTGSFLENAIIQLDSTDKISRLENPTHFGDTHQERLFNVGLELSITWLNRILFLKLLEAQLITYHKGDRSYEFLSLDRIHNYDDLNSLFFQVLARQYDDRNDDVKTLFEKVPYLNSSLFEPTDIEHSTLFISNLRDDKELPIYSATVLKDKKGKKRSGEINALEYLFEFLNAYDFSSEGGETIQEDNKTLINASVLGLIFEKINGYKDGSFFTPGFITMYMCRETIRKAVVQKFNETKSWDCKNLDELYDCIEDRKEANELINSLKICDPAVGSGHFLVSALNEMIAIKNDLNILQDRSGRRLKEYQVEVVNDELIVTDEEGELFEYNPTTKESQRIQEALFHEKQQIIENCLFGVDINPNSIKICRLRLWIELLKNAYYKNETELETLPNIDINIKCGNSLISRFDLDADLSKALKDSKWSIDSYRVAVDTYRNAQNKEQKREMEKIIHDIKNDFRKDIDTPFRRQLGGAKANLSEVETEINIKKQWGEKIPKSLTKLLNSRKKRYGKLKAEKEQIEENKIYDNAFEWRFEFPEVLDDNGDYIGFDVVIGNPPYVPGKDIPVNYRTFIKKNFHLSSGKYDLYIAILERALKISSQSSKLNFIIPNTILANENASLLRKELISKKLLSRFVILDENVFEEAFVESVILEIDKSKNKSMFQVLNSDFNLIRNIKTSELSSEDSYRIQPNISLEEVQIINTILKNSNPLSDILDFCIGIQVGGHGDSKMFKEKYITNSYIDESCKKVIDGKDFDTFTINWNSKFIKYGSWLHRKRDPKYFENPKILIRQIGETPFCTLDFDNYYTLNTIYNGILVNDDYDLKYVFGLITSKTLKFFWKTKFHDGKSLFPKIKKSQLVQIPVFQGSMEEQAKIAKLVDHIIQIKKNKPEANISSFESEIDQLVYELYGLTEEEIEIVEKAVE